MGVAIFCTLLPGRCRKGILAGWMQALMLLPIELHRMALKRRLCVHEFPTLLLKYRVYCYIFTPHVHAEWVQSPYQNAFFFWNAVIHPADKTNIVAGITSLTEASSDKQISSRYLCSPHLFKNTVAKCHTYSGSPNFLWNQFR